MRECVSAHNGRELKTIGGAFLIGFPDPAEGVACACKIQQRLIASPIQAGPGTLLVRIGLHTGTPKVYRDPVSKLQKAIACCEAALRVYTERDFPVDWAMTQNNLGNAYAELPTGDRGANLRKAIGCFEAAIRGYETAGLAEEADRVKRLLASLRQR